MSLDVQWPDDPFWDFSLVLYGQEGAAPICLRLQERHAADVNILLFAAWAGSLGQRLSGAEMDRAKQAVGRWHSEIVVALRGLRTQLKTDAMGSPPEIATAIRAEIKTAELDAEHGEQIMLSAQIKILPQNAGDEPGAAADYNMRLYLESLGATLDKADTDGLRQIAEFAARPTARRP
jgi:uncharacterized protein (TIGR02444 family)